MKKILLLLMMFVVISVPSFATNWKYLLTDIRGNVVYIDKDNIHYYKGYADVWGKRISRDGTWSVELFRITADKRYTFFSITHYNKKGEITFYNDYSYSRPEYFNIVPDSMINAVYTLVYY